MIRPFAKAKSDALFPWSNYVSCCWVVTMIREHSSGVLQRQNWPKWVKYVVSIINMKLEKNGKYLVSDEN